MLQSATNACRNPSSLAAGATTMGGRILAKEEIVRSQLPPNDLIESLRRASGVESVKGLNDQLREHGIESLHFKFVPPADCIITGLSRPGGVRSPGTYLEARLHIVIAFWDQANVRIAVSIRIARRTWIGIIVWPMIVAIWAALLLGGSIGFIEALLLIGCLPSVVSLWKAVALIRKLWPGLLNEVHRIAEGKYLLPAA